MKEPIAWRYRSIFNKDSWILQEEEPIFDNDQYIKEPLYAAPASLAPSHEAETQPDGRVPERETWWLIERKGHGQYTTSPDNMPGLSSDPWRACRFKTEREANDARLRLSTLRDECVVTEHVFINKRPESAPDAGTQEYADDCACGGGDLSGHDAMCPERAGTQEPVADEPRFFIDHDMIHDRETGKHVTTEPDSAFCDGIERCCELLNALAERREPKAFPLLFTNDWLKEKIKTDPDVETEAGRPLYAALRSPQPGTLAREEVARSVRGALRTFFIRINRSHAWASNDDEKLVELVVDALTPSHEAGTQERIQSSTAQAETPIGQAGK